MKTITKVLFLGIVLIGTFSCDKNDLNILETDWKVISIKKQGSSSYQRAEEEYLLKFIDETNFSLNLDVNNCGGSYEIVEEAISFAPFGCTKICCDSKFGQDLAHLFYTTNRYELTGNTLYLFGEGTVKLKAN